MNSSNTIKSRLFALLLLINKDTYTKKELKQYLDIIRNTVGSDCTYSCSFFSGNRWAKPGYLRTPSKKCPYYLEPVSRGVYKVVKEYYPTCGVSTQIAGNQYQYVLNMIDNEGFDYALRNYSTFTEVEDPKLSKLIDTYRAAANAIDSYLQEKVDARAMDIDMQNCNADPYLWFVP